MFLARRVRTALGLLVLICGSAACQHALPEPESEEARLYVQHCSGSGCHAAIPPGRSNAKYWEIQYNRMLETMRASGRQLPTESETEAILGYLRRHAWQ